MPIITISRGSYSRGKEIAQKVAEKLGYECISRDIILEASEEFNIPELKLIRAIHDAPSLFDRLSLKKDKYVAFFRASLTKHFRNDNIVYHGLAGHFFVSGIPHVLKVRIISDFEDRVKCEMEREGISSSKAADILKKDDNQRRKWSKQLYGIDPWDPNLYSLVLHIHKLTVDDATHLICEASRAKAFQTTPQSQQMMDDLALSSEVRAVLLGINLDTEVTAQNGVISVRLTAPVAHEGALVEKIQSAVNSISGIKDVRVNIKPSSL
jgi:cytidylate kinase